MPLNLLIIFAVFSDNNLLNFACQHYYCIVWRHVVVNIKSWSAFRNLSSVCTFFMAADVNTVLLHSIKRTRMSRLFFLCCRLLFFLDVQQDE